MFAAIILCVSFIIYYPSDFVYFVLICIRSSELPYGSAFMKINGALSRKLLSHLILILYIFARSVPRAAETEDDCFTDHEKHVISGFFLLPNRLWRKRRRYILSDQIFYLPGQKIGSHNQGCHEQLINGFSQIILAMVVCVTVCWAGPVGPAEHQAALHGLLGIFNRERRL
jgi:hypothetical protein